MVIENPDAVYPSPIAQNPEINVIGKVAKEAVDRVQNIVESEIQAVHTHYSQLGIRPNQQLSPVTFQVNLYDNDTYRKNGSGANTWRHNYVLNKTDGSGILLNSAILQEMSDEHPIPINHEIRHNYIAQVVGDQVFASSFSLREGTAGLSVDSTARLLSILKEGNDELYLPLSINHWDRQLDKEQTNKRCFIDNPWYLSMFSFFHDYIGVQQNGMGKLIEVYPAVADYNDNLSLAWKKTQSGQPTLEDLQERWLTENKLNKFKIKE
ncbi:hypothetical protein KKG24_04175 [Patescibacteria group bacterium]|nr:hypothetical protein [Patescibacteria group bacterium]